jgi:uncharacterized membrane protein YgdD (TMEM256/DUF423 family)
MARRLLIAAALTGFLGVALGAFGAHALRRLLTPEMLAVFETGVRYQMYHAFALAIAALCLARWPVPAFRVAGWLFAAGMVVFCGSLYLLALTGVKSLGAITPLGGLLLLAGWITLAIGAGRIRE